MFLGGFCQNLKVVTTVGGNAMRAVVWGSNDGLASNMSLVMGVAELQFQITPYY
jgi:hypothetical protein